MKWFGQIGYWTSHAKDDDPFTIIQEVVPKDYYGEIIRNYKRDQSASTINDSFNINNQISVLADPFILENFHHMRYVTFMGSKWKIKSAEVVFPRIILDIGDLYSEETDEEDTNG